MSFYYAHHDPVQTQTSLTIGQVRPLTGFERESYPGFRYVVTQYYCYTQGIFTIMIPPDFLVTSNVCWKIFKEYMYRSHQFSSGQGCSRHQANTHLFEIIQRSYNMGICRFYNYISLSILDQNWFSRGVRQWHRHGLTDIPMIK